MNVWNLFNELRRHRKYAGVRNVNVTRNRTAKYIIYVLFAFVIIYLMIIAAGLAFIVNDSDNNEISSVEFISALLPFILIIDFFCRFIMQQTPSQIIKPYTLLPIKRSDCINNFIAVCFILCWNINLCRNQNLSWTDVDCLDINQLFNCFTNKATCYFF